ncbi:MAG TPA: hypothetical protein VJU80_05850 [Solirubrobacteraceae bacterium]|nr:hypothetical protein [Solirubrobacteraceae bacterium]
MLTVAVASAPAAAGAGAGAPTVAASISSAPEPVTAGEPVRYLTTLADNGPATITHVELTLPMPSGVTVESAEASSGSCTTALDQAHCTIGTLVPGGAAQVTVIARTSTPGVVSVTAMWTAVSGLGDTHDYPATVSTTIAAPSADLVAGFVPPSGDTLSTDPGTGATASNPQVTTATIPATADGTPAALSEKNASGPGDACAPSATCFGQVSTITIGQTFSPGHPLRFAFVLDKSEIPKHTKLNTIPMYHDGVPVANCAGSPGVASPDPCVVSRTKLATQDVQIVVLSSTNGRWRP